MDRLGMIISIVFALLCGIPDARAGQVVFTKDYAYQASEADSKLCCRAIAVEQVKRLLLEQVGTFVQSKTVVKDFQLSKDQVVSMTAGIVMNNLLDKGTSLLEAGDNEKAFQVFEEAVRTYPTEKRAYMKRGVANARLDRLDDALRDYDKALELDPKFAKPYFGRGLVFRKLGKTEEAIKQFDKAIELNREFAEAYFARGMTYLKMRERDRGIRDLEYSAALGYKKARLALVERGRI